MFSPQDTASVAANLHHSMYGHRCRNLTGEVEDLRKLYLDFLIIGVDNRGKVCIMGLTSGPRPCRGRGGWGLEHNARSTTQCKTRKSLISSLI